MAAARGESTLRGRRVLVVSVMAWDKKDRAKAYLYVAQDNNAGRTSKVNAITIKNAFPLLCGEDQFRRLCAWDCGLGWRLRHRV